MGKKLTDEQVIVSRAWLHDIFIWGGLVPEASTRRPHNYS